jgi:hypothetical protein
MSLEHSALKVASLTFQNYLAVDSPSFCLRMMLSSSSSTSFLPLRKFLTR